MSKALSNLTEKDSPPLNELHENVLAMTKIPAKSTDGCQRATPASSKVLRYMVQLGVAAVKSVTDFS